jgi:hypothetical protein
MIEEMKIKCALVFKTISGLNVLLSKKDAKD